MKILFASTPAPGHLNPLLAMAQMAKERGDDVVMITGNALAPMVDAAGLRFVALPPEADLDFRHLEVTDPERAKLPPGPAQLRYDFERIFLDPMPSQAAALRALIAEEAPDLIIADNLFCGTTPVFLDPAPHPPIVICSITFLTLQRPDGAPLGPGLPPARDDADRARNAAVAAEVDRAFTDPVKHYADAKLAGLGLPPLDGTLMHARISHCDAFLMPTVPSFEYDFGALPDHIRFVGALPAPPATAPLPDWWAELDEGRKVVLVTQGTVANTDLGQLIEPTLTALAARDDLLVIVTMGGRPVDDLASELPANARTASFLPFESLLPKVDLLVTNGGYGTINLALEAGVPILVAGLTEDKAEVAARVAWSGAGVNLATNNPTTEAIRAGVDKVLTHRHYGSRAQALAAAFAAIDNPAGNHVDPRSRSPSQRQRRCVRQPTVPTLRTDRDNGELTRCPGDRFAPNGMIASSRR